MGHEALSFTPILRSPPFPGIDAAISRALPETSPLQAHRPEASAPADPAAIFAIVREARVGGRFWAAPAVPPDACGSVRRPLNLAECADVDPWSVLPGARLLSAHGDDEWIVLARVAGVAVEVLSPGRFGAPGDDGGRLDQLAAAALMAVQWRDPFTGGPSHFEAAVELLALWRAVLDANRPLVAASGMAWWKRKEIRRFLWHPQHSLKIVSAPSRALRVARKAGGALAIWPSRVSPALVGQARAQGVPLVRVEDGFVRSVGLGVDLVPPSSVVVDASGIHFDPSGPSDLETLLNGAEMPRRLLDRARTLRETIVKAGISKYAAGPGTGNADSFPERLAGKRLVLVTGQVEDDMSVLAAGGDLVRETEGANLALLRRARALEPDAEIWFRPHPDVDAGHRKGAVPDAQALVLADRVVRGGGMAPLLETVDAVHVLTSLAGFEALLRGREVICHGTPFYAGWGLTRDLGEVPARRTRRLTLDALVAGVLILYPRYLDPVTGLPCPPEVLVGRMASASAANRLSWIAPLRRWQGKLMNALR